MRTLIARNVVLLCVLIAVCTANYEAIYISFCSYLIAFFATTRRLNAKVCSAFFIAYFVIPFPNISDYRGTISATTLLIYAASQFAVLHMLEKFERSAPISIRVPALSETSATRALFLAHLAVIYATVAYVYATTGPIIIRQDLRFSISPTIEYVIKSGLALPLVWIFSEKFRVSGRSLLEKVLLPILPSILIGSRGTFVMILLAIAVALYMFSRFGPSSYLHSFRKIYREFRVYRVGLALLAVAALYSGFYIRRDGHELITAKDLIIQHSFSTPAAVSYAVLPIYIGLREGPGITNRIIEEGVRNPTDTALFFSELLTPLPGHQVAPGIVLARDVYHAEGADEKYSLTPGIIGGLYIDFGVWGLAALVALSLGLVGMYNRGLTDLKWRAFYCLTVVQFFHLYHRGFLKVEYFVPYFVLGAMLYTMHVVKDDV